MRGKGSEAATVSHVVLPHRVLSISYSAVHKSMSQEACTPLLCAPPPPSQPPNAFPAKYAVSESVSNGRLHNLSVPNLTIVVNPELRILPSRGYLLLSILPRCGQSVLTLTFQSLARLEMLPVHLSSASRCAT